MLKTVPIEYFDLYKISNIPILKKKFDLEYYKQHHHPKDFLNILRQKRYQQKVKSKLKKSISLTITIGILFISPPSHKITFLLIYKDNIREHLITIQEPTSVSSSSLIVSNTIDIEYIGDIDYMTAYCSGIDNTTALTVDIFNVEMTNFQLLQKIQ